MSGSGPQGNPEPAEAMAAAFTSFTRAVKELAGSLRPVLAESFRPVAQTLAKIAADPRVQAAIAADREPGRTGCHCLCAAVHRDDPGICDGESVATVQISGMNVPMCAPCQAARAASKLSRPT